MKRAPAYAAVVLVSAVIIGFVFVTPQLQSGKGPSPGSTFSLQYVRTGGLAGVKDTLLVNNSGLATYNSSFGTSFRVSLAPFEFSHFKQVLSANVGSVQPKTLDAKSGAADYFGYGLTVKFDDQTTQLSWVDEWA